ncbi:hypothetical protein QTP86_012030 [Hemibagrus guttatus]|nr:hypothetical protein QTP86_012030 [Hemibagrus guttatus]
MNNIQIFRGRRCPARHQRRRVPAAPSSHPPAPWEVPDPSKTDIIAPEPSFVGGRRSVRVLGSGRRSALLLSGGCRLALLLNSGSHSALLLGCGCRSAPPLGCGRRVGPFGLAVGSCAPTTCLAPASHSPHMPRLDPRSPHLPRLGPRFPPLALLLLLAPPPPVPRPASRSPHRPLYVPSSSSGPIAGPDFLGRAKRSQRFPTMPHFQRLPWGFAQATPVRFHTSATTNQATAVLRLPPRPDLHRLNNRDECSGSRSRADRGASPLSHQRSHVRATSNHFRLYHDLYFTSGDHQSRGSAEDCNGFLLQCSLALEMQPHLYADDRAKVAFIISHLDGKALRWAEPIWTQNNPIVTSLPNFIEHFKEFRTLVATSGWNEQALITTYRQGVDPHVRLNLAAYKDFIGLEKFIQLSIRFTTRMQLCLEEPQDQPLFSTTLRQPDPVSHPEPASEPMHLENSGVSATERQRGRQRRLTQNRCFYCGHSGHYIVECPLCPARSMLRLKTTATPKVYQIHAVTGKPLRQVRRLVGPLHLQIGARHTEEIYLLVLEDSTADVVLGCPWLEQHNPIHSWKTGEILKWGEQCFEGCFLKLPVPKPPRSHEIPVHAMSVESPLEASTTAIPACYSHFSDVFCPRKASKLPPHRPWGCAIDLIPGEPVPRGKIYSLSIPEKKALSQGYIHPSTSPAASSFLFVAKKNGGLRPCIDYRALNKITVKFRYPLPLIPSVLERLHGVTVFTKLDLHSAYNLIRIREGDEWKTAFVTPTGHYEYLVMSYGLVNAPSVF